MDKRTDLLLGLLADDDAIASIYDDFDIPAAPEGPSDAQWCDWIDGACAEAEFDAHSGWTPKEDA